MLLHVTPLLLAQLDHVDLGKLAETLLGAGGSAVVVGLIARQWVGERLRELAQLKKKAEADRLWKVLARRHMRAQHRELNRTANNLHELREFVQGVSSEVERLAEASSVRVRMPEPPQWERAQLAAPDLVLNLDEDDEDDEKEGKDLE